jgi:hypothetical protein
MATRQIEIDLLYAALRLRGARWPGHTLLAPVQIPPRSRLTTTATGGKVPRDLVRPLPLTFTITVFAVFCGAPCRDSGKCFHSVC